MMSQSWQDILVFAVVAASAACILLRGYRTIFGAAKGCGGGCSGCVAQQAEPQGWVPLEALTGDRRD